VADYYGSVPLVNYIVSDGAEETSATLTLTVTPVNDPPILDLDGAVAGSGFVTTFTENGAGVSISAPSALVTDVDDTAMESATIVLTNAQLGDMLVAGTLPAGITASAYNPTTGTITLSGTATKADYTAAINAITFVATNDMPSTVDRLIDVTVNDGDLNSNTATTTVHVIAVDDAPVNNLPAVFTMAAGATVNLSGISLTDPDAGSGNMTVTFSTTISNLGVGLLQLDTTVPGGITAAQVTGNGTASITINAPLAAINATLAAAHGLDYTAPAGLTPVSFVMKSNDNGNTGINGPKTDFDVRTIKITPPPVATNDSATTNEETSVSISVLTNDLLGGSGIGNLVITEVGGLPIVAGGASVPVANGTVTLGLDGKLTFQPAPDFNGSTTFNYTINNGENGTATGVVLVNVTPVNDAPAGTDKIITTLEDIAHTFTAADFGFTDPLDAPTPNNFQSVIITTLPTNGTLSLANVAVTAEQLISVSDIPNLIWTPDLNSNGNGLTSFTFQVVDDGGMLLGNKDTDLSPNTITLNVTPVNDDPVLSLNPSNSGGDPDNNGSAAIYVENSTPVAVVDTDVIINDINEVDLVSLTIAVTDVISSSEEILTIAGHVFPLNQNVISPITATVGGIAVAISYDASTQIFTIVNTATGDTLPKADLQLLLQGMRYEHTGETPTAGDRSLTFTVTDSSNATSVPGFLK
jgi:Bacterial Ig domain